MLLVFLFRALPTQQLAGRLKSQHRPRLASIALLTPTRFSFTVHIHLINLKIMSNHACHRFSSKSTTLHPVQVHNISTLEMSPVFHGSSSRSPCGESIRFISHADLVLIISKLFLFVITRTDFSVRSKPRDTDDGNEMWTPTFSEISYKSISVCLPPVFLSLSVRVADAALSLLWARHDYAGNPWDIPAIKHSRRTHTGFSRFYIMQYYAASS